MAFLLITPSCSCAALFGCDASEESYDGDVNAADDDGECRVDVETVEGYVREIMSVLRELTRVEFFIAWVEFFIRVRTQTQVSRHFQTVCWGAHIGG